MPKKYESGNPSDLFGVIIERYENRDGKLLTKEASPIIDAVYALLKEMDRGRFTEEEVSRLHGLAMAIVAFLNHPKYQASLAEVIGYCNSTVVPLESEATQWIRDDEKRLPGYIKHALADLGKHIQLTKTSKATQTGLGYLIKLANGGCEKLRSDMSDKERQKEHSYGHSMTIDLRNFCKDGAPIETFECGELIKRDRQTHNPRAEVIFHFIFNQFIDSHPSEEQRKENEETLPYVQEIFLEQDKGLVIKNLPWESNLFNRSPFLYSLFLVEILGTASVRKLKRSDKIKDKSLASKSIGSIRDNLGALA